MTQYRWWVGVIAASIAAFSCGGDEEINSFPPAGGAGGSGGTGAAGGSGAYGGSGGSGGGGLTGPCEVGDETDCYTGPPDTMNVGVCVPGTSTCDSSGWGPCEGEVVPTDEVCATPGDDDCDGLTNEEGPDCACSPGTSQDCYSGPPNTEDVGLCHGGTQICDQDGNGYGPCTGEVVPIAEDCNTPEDENCDGLTPPCQGDPIIDLRADNNRNGTVEIASASEDANEDTWNANHGAIFLANLDDDQDACPTSGTDQALASCNDAADTVINGASDLLDLARLEIVPWPDAPGDASATLTVSAGAANYVRLFKNNGGTFQLYTPGSTITDNELVAGVEFGIEARDIVRDDTVWDGYVNVTLNVEAGTGPNGPYQDGTDTVRMRVAPVLFRHHADPAEQNYSSYPNGSAGAAFHNDLVAAINAAGVPNPLWQLSTTDRWTQDYFETAYMSMPAPGGMHVIHINFRSANYSGGGLRTAGRLVFTALRGPDVAGAVEYDPNHPNGMDSLNSFGNLETIPPYGTWPLGRVIRGSTASFYPDQDFQLMITAQGADSNNSQGIQDLVLIDTEWLLVGHVDETLSFFPHASGTHGWLVAVSDTVLGWNTLVNLANGGYGNTAIFQGTSDQTTINGIINNADNLSDNQWAATEISSQRDTLKQALGIVDADFVPLPSVWFDGGTSWLVAYVPGIVNGIWLNATNFGPPEPHGPIINGSDPFKDLTEQAFSPLGVTVRWIEDFEAYHVNEGEVHCGSNTTREIPDNVYWWESGK